MANKQINELTEITSIEESDLLVVYDVDEVGTEKTKKILKSNFLPYAEGVFIPEVADASVGGNTGSAGTAEGFYTKIGRAVHIYINIQNINTAGMTSSNSMFIRNLPFSGITSTRFLGQGWFQNVTLGGYLTRPLMDSVSIAFHRINSGDIVSSVLVSHFTSGIADVRISMTYFV